MTIVPSLKPARSPLKQKAASRRFGGHFLAFSAFKVRWSMLDGPKDLIEFAVRSAFAA